MIAELTASTDAVDAFLWLVGIAALCFALRGDGGGK